MGLVELDPVEFVGPAHFRGESDRDRRALPERFLAVHQERQRYQERQRPVALAYLGRERPAVSPHRDCLERRAGRSFELKSPASKSCDSNWRRERSARLVPQGLVLLP